MIITSTTVATLPWRITTDPYRILISEVMLQQTQVSRVIEKYQDFIGLFPISNGWPSHLFMRSSPPGREWAIIAAPLTEKIGPAEQRIP
jgi:hypothetical protein